MNEKNKIIRDPIHGDIKFSGIFLDLIDAPELQRLYSIKQLGFAHLVFPGGHHTRLEHSIGTFFMAEKVANILNIQDNNKILLTCSALLHDIGHGPFSHTLESLLRDSLNVDHVDLTEQLILGDHAIFNEEERRIIHPITVFDILEKYSLDQKSIINILRNKNKNKKYLGQLLNSCIDVDQLDYLIRDAYYTGVSYGMIDAERFLQTLTIFNDNLGVKKKGVGVVENILMARALMYSSVYFHKTVRIAELMLSKAIELMENADPFEIFKMTDAELMNYLYNRKGYQKEIAARIKFRKLFKQAVTISKNDITKEKFDIIRKFDDISYRREKEMEFEKFLKIPEGHVIIDFPYTDLHLSEPRIDKTDIDIIESDGVKNLNYYTPVGDAVKSRTIPDWIVMIATEEKYKDIISKNFEKIIYN